VRTWVLRQVGEHSPARGAGDLGADILQEEEVEPKAEAECPRPGHTIFTDSSWLDSGAAGYSVAWQNDQRWVGIKKHMGYNQESYGAECAFLAKAPETTVKRQTTPEKATIFTGS